MNKGKAVVRVCLYRKECPEGQVFSSQEAVDEAREDGWKDVPPGFKGDKNPVQVAKEETAAAEENNSKLAAENEQLRKQLEAATKGKGGARK